MSNVTTFYTPGTGLPDFEMRIALGLCAAALNAVEPDKLSLEKTEGGYAIKVKHCNAKELMRNALSWFCLNSIGDYDKLNNISGFYGAILKPTFFKKSGKERFPGYAKMFARYGMYLQKADPEKLFNIAYVRNKTIRTVFLSCGHEKNSDMKMTAITPLSPEIGKVPLPSRGHTYRRAINRDNLDVCPLCATLAILGSSTFQIHLIVPAKEKGRQIYSFLPHFSGTVSGNALSEFCASSRFIKQWQKEAMGLSMTSMGIVLLASYPHIVKLLSEYNIPLQGFFVAVAEQKDQAPRYVGKFEQTIELDTKYLMFSPYNRALVSQIYKESRFINYRSELLGLLVRSLQNQDEKSALDFARSYVGATESKAMLPWSSSEFFAKEVFDMDISLLEGEKFKIIKEVADMLQYFVRERNFGYVDNLRKARDADEFAKLLLDVQREAQSAMLDPKKQIKPFLPGQNTIQRLLQLINEAEKQFKSVQTLVALLAFTYYKKEA